jgi:pyridoxamine 5'-phosphate oxidase
MTVFNVCNYPAGSPDFSPHSHVTTARTAEPLPDHYNNLTATLAYVWQLLHRACADRHAGFHTPVLATQGADGPQTRVLVLRAVDQAARSVLFYTDARSAKLHALAHDARVALNFYDAARKVQLRTRGTAHLHTQDTLANTHWNTATLTARRCYLGAAPGQLSDAPTSGLPAALEGRAPTLEEVLPGRAHFAVLQVVLHEIEWLHVHSTGHRRARFGWTGGPWKEQWLNP